MTMFSAGLLLVVLAGSANAPTAPGAQEQGELVRNPDFRAGGEEGLPEHWSAWQPAWRNNLDSTSPTDPSRLSICARQLSSVIT